MEGVSKEEGVVVLPRRQRWVGVDLAGGVEVLEKLGASMTFSSMAVEACILSCLVRHFTLARWREW